MILYQLAKRLEQRNRLQSTINQSEGDVAALVIQKEQMDEQLQTQANAWIEEGQDEFVLAALTPDTEILRSNQLSL